jgi:hypothetical protein
MPDGGAEMVGLAALVRDLARLFGDGGRVLKYMREAGVETLQPVAAATRSELPQVSGRLAGDVRFNPNHSGAVVRMGSPSVRYAGWVEFGGNRRVPFASHRAYTARGRYLFERSWPLAGVAPRAYGEEIGQAIRNMDWTNSGSDPGSVHD